MSTIGERLAEERKRLGKNQTEFAELGGAKRASQVNYETNKRRPDADYLAAIAEAGVDVCYVLTAKRSLATVLDGGGSNAPAPTHLDRDQRRLLQAWEDVPNEQRLAVLNLVESMAVRVVPGVAEHQRRVWRQMGIDVDAVDRMIAEHDARQEEEARHGKKAPVTPIKKKR